MGTYLRKYTVVIKILKCYTAVYFYITNNNNNHRCVVPIVVVVLLANYEDCRLAEMSFR